MVVGVTGHRPNKLWGYGVEAKIPEEKMRIYFMNKLKEMKATEAITGMANCVRYADARNKEIVQVRPFIFN